ncbi:hypothetical protein [Streptomyces sp. ODS28]|uniref:hypothetical protein n=1 Tax=Streptomyces sp. ODS28 TaxID=3136688 RepID=UPI0031E51FCE
MRLLTATTAAAALAGASLVGTAGSAAAEANTLSDATHQAATAAQITADNLNLLPKEANNTIELGGS